MTTASKRAIEVVEEHLVDDGLITMPIDLLKIAGDLGIEVVESTLEEGTAGIIVSDPPAPTKIVLNRADAQVRRRFTLAHELGHFIRRRDNGTHKFGYVDRRDELSSRAEDDEEMWANRFAAHLLMPPPLVRKFFSEGMSVDRMAREFRVSTTAMGYHLQNIGLQ